ncbi:hypothetical protein DFH09DRAFT_1079905 [Mycena vulgaris]|nr:hypothetical protein DFH09DRAFT_1079905 [Mycena vulgaris]
MNRAGVKALDYIHRSLVDENCEDLGKISGGFGDKKDLEGFGNGGPAHGLFQRRVKNLVAAGSSSTSSLYNRPAREKGFNAPHRFSASRPGSSQFCGVLRKTPYVELDLGYLSFLTVPAYSPLRVLGPTSVVQRSALGSLAWDSEARSAFIQTSAPPRPRQKGFNASSSQISDSHLPKRTENGDGGVFSVGTYFFGGVWAVGMSHVHIALVLESELEQEIEIEIEVAIHRTRDELELSLGSDDASKEKKVRAKVCIGDMVADITSCQAIILTATLRDSRFSMNIGKIGGSLAYVSKSAKSRGEKQKSLALKTVTIDAKPGHFTRVTYFWTQGTV